MNKLILIGNLTRDPEKRQTQDGRSVCNFTLAVNNRTSRDHPEADYFRVTTWDQTADNCAKFLAKGRKAYVEGPVHLEQYTDRDGVIRYNLIYDLGADGHRPQGIYMDDALAGQTIYGNVMVNVPNFGLQLGGGQDLDVHDNIVINSYCPISYDDRGLTGLSGDESSSFYQHYKQNGDVWKLLYESPWQTETWLKAYPQYLRYSDDFNNTDDRNFVLNPGNSTVTHNLLISARGTVGDIADTVYQYSTVEDNPCFKLSQLKKIFVDPENGDYTVREDVPIDFKPDVPAMSEFGRQ